MKTITIMADFGSAYAWLNDTASEVAHIGPNIADAGGFDKKYGVPAVLEEQLAAWIRRFERDAFDPSFDWNGFHQEGIALCRHLKRQWGETYRVVYQKPREDPNHAINKRTEVP